MNTGTNHEKAMIWINQAVVAIFKKSFAWVVYTHIFQNVSVEELEHWETLLIYNIESI